MKNNPYTLLFGKEPQEVIPRFAQTEEIIDWFESEPSPQQICMITGVRGSGKTVQMTMLQKYFDQKKEWITVELNPDADLLQSLAAKLSSRNVLARIFQQAGINLSYFGIGLEVTGTVPITDIETALSQMLASLKKKKKKILIAIDEVTSNSQVQIFAKSFQIFVRQDLPVYLIMTGLYENIYELQNEKSLTFLYRAPKVVLEPLNIGTIADNYQRVLELDRARALEMAKLTRGYSFAFQVLGYYSWEYRDHPERAFSVYKQYLQENVYVKIWAELSAGDKQLAYGIAKTPGGKTGEIRELLQIGPERVSPYRDRLIRKGIVDGRERGHMRFTLPQFEEFVLENYEG